MAAHEGAEPVAAHRRDAGRVHITQRVAWLEHGPAGLESGAQPVINAARMCAGAAAAEGTRRESEL